MKKILYILLIFIYSCTPEQYDLTPQIYPIEGDWNLTIAYRITRYVDIYNNTASVNYFIYPDVPFPHKYKRGDVFDTIIPGKTIWSFDENYMYKDHNEKMMYFHRNINSAYCEYIRVMNHDVYQVIELSDNKLILETNEQLDDYYFVFNHFTILEFSRNNDINNEFYTSNECTNISEESRESIITNEVAPYNPYEGSDILAPILGEWTFVSYQRISDEGFPIGDMMYVNNAIEFNDDYTYLINDLICNYGFYNQYGGYNEFYGLYLYDFPIIGTVKTNNLPRSFGDRIDCVFRNSIGQEFQLIFQR